MDLADGLALHVSPEARACAWRVSDLIIFPGFRTMLWNRAAQVRACGPDPLVLRKKGEQHLRQNGIRAPLRIPIHRDGWRYIALFLAFNLLLFLLSSLAWVRSRGGGSAFSWISSMFT